MLERIRPHWLKARRTPAHTLPTPWLAFLALVALWLVALYPSVAAAAQIASTRMWPSQEYTRVTIESASVIRYSIFSVTGPDRIVLDLDGVDASPHLDALPEKVLPTDPDVKGIRIGRFKPTVLRIVFDLKDGARAEAFALTPVGSYGHRLVLDIHPLKPIDPLLALIEQTEQSETAGAGTAERGATGEIALKATPVAIDPSARAPARRVMPGASSEIRPLVIAIDAGHGGEDPGAIGPKRHAMQKHLWRVSWAVLPYRHVFDFNQALMDFGALVCAARRPQCPTCPLGAKCVTYGSSSRRKQAAARV
jgi:N-acetylmuramoyl-L-alanine amidase